MSKQTPFQHRLQSAEAAQRAGRKRHDVAVVSAEITTRLKRARRRQRIVQSGQLALGVLGVILITLAVLLRVLPQPIREVTTPPQPLPNYRLVTLDAAAPSGAIPAYNLTVQQAQAAAGYTLWLPTQLRETFTYAGARYDRLEQTVELAFLQTAGPQPHKIVWVFTQRPTRGGEQDKILFNQYSAEFFPEKRLIDIRNAEFGTTPATFQQYQQGSGRNASQFENRLAWQADGQQFTIAAMADIRIDETIVGAYGEKWWLTELQR